MATPSDLVGPILPGLHGRNNGTCGRTFAPVRGKRTRPLGPVGDPGRFRAAKRKGSPLRISGGGYRGGRGRSQPRPHGRRADGKPIRAICDAEGPAATAAIPRSGSAGTRTKTAGRVTVALVGPGSPCQHLGDRRRPVTQHLRWWERRSIRTRHPRPTQPQGRRQNPLRSGSESPAPKTPNAAPDDLPARFRYPTPDERKPVRTANAVERRFREVRWRTRPMGISRAAPPWNASPSP